MYELVRYESEGDHILPGLVNPHTAKSPFPQRGNGLYRPEISGR
jgi:hypothetical protein